jgi:hypothetical protein
MRFERGKLSQGFNGAGCRHNVRFGVFQNVSEHFARIGVVVNDQNPNSDKIIFRGFDKKIRLTVKIFIRRLRQKQRQHYTKSRSRALARAFRRDRAAVHFDQIFDDRKSETETAVFAFRAAVSLPETLENERQKILRDALSRIAYDDFGKGVDFAQDYFDLSF